MADQSLNGTIADDGGGEALRRSEERLRLALDAGRIGVWDWDIATGRVRWSDQVAEFYGLGPGEFDGTLEMFARHLHPEDADRAHAAIRASVDGGAPYRVEYRIVRKGGEVRWINSSGHVVRDAAGVPVRMIGATSDVTDRRRAEDERGRLARTLRLALDAGDLGTWEWDPATDGIVLSDRAGEIYGVEPGVPHPREQLRGLLHPDHRDRARDEAARAVAARTDYDIEYPLVTGRWVAARGRGAFGPDGALTRVTGVVQDVTARKAAEAALRASEERFRRAIGIGTVGVLFFTLDGRMTDANAAFERMSGYSRDELRGATHWEALTRPEFLEVTARAAGELGARGETAPYEKEMVRKDGSRWWGLFAPTRLSGTGPGSECVEFVIDVTNAKRAEEAVRERDERIHLLLDNATDYAVIISDPEDRVTGWLGGAEQITGWRADEAAGKPAAVIFTPEDRAAGVPGRETGKAAATGRAENVRWHLRKDGSRFFAEGVTVALRGPGGELRGFGKVFRDATARKRAEEAVRASEERYRTLFTSIDQGFCVVEVLFDGDRPTDYRFVEANPVFEQQTGLAHPVGRTARELVPGLEERWVELYGRVAATGEPTRVVQGSAAMGRWFDAFASRTGGPGSRTVAVLFTDITDHKRAEAERERLLREVEAERGRLADVFQRAPSFMCVLRGPGHVFERANDRYLELIGGRDIIDKPVREALPEVEGQGFFEILDGVYQTGEPFVGTDMRVTLLRNGRMEERVLEFVYLAVRDAGGAVSGVLAHGVDLTERVRAEDEVRAADRKKDDFIALLAHELRNPLAPIRNGLQVIRLSEDRATRDRSQKMMDRQLAHMVRMIDDLLDVSRIGRNKMELRRGRVALADVVNSAVETARPAIEEAGHELTVSLPQQPVPLDADLTRLSQVLSNLLTNSAKYTERGGKIWLAVEPRGAEVVVSVGDTGIGIPAESLPHIFDMFSQVDRSTERSTGGLGIGLALVKGLVEMHGGTVTARSEGQGRGSTFVVTLPVQPDATEPAHAADDGRLSPRTERRVLVVDDNRDGAESLAEMLRLLGNEVATAHDGHEAVAQAERFRPEVVLMDIGMPKLNGLDATRQIRGQAWGRDMTIIALTGWGQESDRERTREAGCDGHLVKPVELAALEKLMTEVGVGG